MLVVLAALAVAVLGVTRLIGSLSAEAPAGQVGSLNGLTAQVTTVGWVAMDHDMSTTAPGYQMPPAMMPGMPEQGKERLSVTVTVTNTSAGTRPVVPRDEFALHATKDGALIAPHSDTFGELPRLAPQNAVTGALFFDLPPGDVADSAAWIEWSHSGTSTKFAVPLNTAGSGPAHQHNP
jgi:hypothetical protein